MSLMDLNTSLKTTTTFLILLLFLIKTRGRKTILARRKSKTKKRYDCVVIPQFVYQDMLDAAWLAGMECCELDKSNSYTISNPAYYVKMQCDVHGCSVKAGMGLTFIPISTEQKTVMIDRPFYFWVERSGSNYTLIEGAMNGDFLETSEEGDSEDGDSQEVDEMD